MNEIRKDMPYEEKQRRSNAITDAELLPVLEGFYGRPLTEAEKRTVYGHVSMFFIGSGCPLEELNAHDIEFGSRMIARLERKLAQG